MDEALKILKKCLCYGQICLDFELALNWQHFQKTPEMATNLQILL